MPSTFEMSTIYYEEQQKAFIIRLNVEVCRRSHIVCEKYKQYFSLSYMYILCFYQETKIHVPKFITKICSDINRFGTAGLWWVSSGLNKFGGISPFQCQQYIFLILVPVTVYEIFIHYGHSVHLKCNINYKSKSKVSIIVNMIQGRLLK